jgi:hypothetical protein
MPHTSVGVKALFPISDRRILYAHLESPDWDWRWFGPVDLLIGDRKIRLRYTGFGNHEGSPVVVLEPTDQSVSVAEIAGMLSTARAASIRLRRPSEFT